MKKNRYYHLSYCSVCQNRTSNLQNGIICNLTNKQADFNDNCPNYNLDNKQLEKVKNDIAFKIDNNLCNNSSSLDPNSEDGWKFYPLTQSSFSKYKTKQDTIGLKIGKKKFYQYLFLGFSIFFFLWIIIGALRSEDKIDFKEQLLAVCILVLPFLLLGIKQLRDNKVYFETLEKMMILNNHTIAWNDIITVGYSQHLIGTGDGMKSTNMVIGTKSRGLIFTNIDNINISSQEIADLIFLNQNNNT